MEKHNHIKLTQLSCCQLIEAAPPLHQIQIRPSKCIARDVIKQKIKSLTREYKQTVV